MFPRNRNFNFYGCCCHAGKLKKVKKKRRRDEELSSEESPRRHHHQTKVFAKFSHDTPPPGSKKKHLSIEQLNARRRKVWLSIVKKELPKVSLTNGSRSVMTQGSEIENLVGSWHLEEQSKVRPGFSGGHWWPDWNSVICKQHVLEISPVVSKWIMQCFTMAVQPSAMRSAISSSRYSHWSAGWQYRANQYLGLL